LFVNGTDSQKTHICISKKAKEIKEKEREEKRIIRGKKTCSTH